MVVAVIWLGLAGFLVGDACEFIGHGGGVVVVVGHEYFEAVGAVMEDEAGAMQGAGFTFLGREDADGCDGGHIDPVAVWEFGEFHACSGLAGWFGGLGVFELGGEAADGGGDGVFGDFEVVWPEGVDGAGGRACGAGGCFYLAFG